MTPLPAARIRAFQLDLARHPEEPAEIVRMARLAAGWGCTHLVLYLEGTIASPACPAPAAPRVYTEAEVRGFAAGILAAGLQIVPVIPCLGHAEHVVRSAAWSHLAEEAEGHGRFGAVGAPTTLCPSHPGTVPLLAEHIRHVCSLLPGADLHLGLDEAFNLGVCQRCRCSTDLGELWTAHLHALTGAMAPLGRRLWIWDDALELYPQALDAIPAGMLLCHWGYDAQIDAAGIQGHLVNRRRRDWLAEYRRRGLEALACPWLKVPQNVLQFSSYALRHPGTGLLLTTWDHTHRILPAIGLVARTALRTWRGEDPEAAWNATAADLAGADGPLLAALGSLVAPDPVLPPEVLLGGPPSVTEDQQERLLAACEPALDRLPAGDSATACDGRMLAWWTRRRLAQLRLRRCLPDLADPSLPAPRRLLAVARSEALAGALESLVATIPAVFPMLGGDGPDRACRERLHTETAALLGLLRRLLAGPPTALLVLRLHLQDCHGVPRLAIDSDGSSGGWCGIAAGCWKPGADGTQLVAGHFSLAFLLDRSPTRLRLSGGGLGGAGVCHVAVRTTDGIHVPASVIAVEGAVQDANALLQDDSSCCRLGTWDIAQPIRRPPSHPSSGSVELSLTGPSSS